MPGRDQRDAGSWPCQTHEGRAVHPGLFLRKQLDKRRTFILDVDEQHRLHRSPLPGTHPAHRHSTQPAVHTCSQAPGQPLPAHALAPTQ